MAGPQSVDAHARSHVIPGALESAGTRELYTADNTAGGRLLQAVPPDARIAWIQNQGTGSVTFNDDGATAPSATEGKIFVAGADIWFCGDLAKLKFFDSGGSSAPLHVSYYR